MMRVASRWLIFAIPVGCQRSAGSGPAPAASSATGIQATLADASAPRESMDLETRFQHQEEAGAWGVEKQPEFTRALAVAPGIALHSIECRRAMCRIEISYLDDAKAAQYFEDSELKPPLLGCRVAHIPSKAADGRRLIFIEPH
jgi:hypothetical protein